MTATNLEIVPNHHFEHQKQFTVGNVPISIHVVHLESD